MTRQLPFFAELERSVKGGFTPVEVTGVSSIHKAMLCMTAAEEKRIFVLCDDEAACTRLAAVINELLTLAGSPTALVVPSDKVLATDRADWPMGTDVLTIANDLLREIGYAPIWADPRGFLRAAPAPALDGSRIDWIYAPSGTPAQRLTAGGSSRYG